MRTLTSHEEREGLVEIFGEDYKKGIAENPHIVPRRDCPRSRSEMAKKKKEERIEKGANRAIEKALKEQLEKGQLSGRKMAQYQNLLN